MEIRENLRAKTSWMRSQTNARNYGDKNVARALAAELWRNVSVTSFLNRRRSSRLCCARRACYPQSRTSRSASRTGARPSRWWDPPVASEIRRCARTCFSSWECSSRSWSRRFSAGDPWRSDARSSGSFSRLYCRLGTPRWKGSERRWEVWVSGYMVSNEKP